MDYKVLKAHKSTPPATNAARTPNTACGFLASAAPVNVGIGRGSVMVEGEAVLVSVPLVTVVGVVVEVGTTVAVVKVDLITTTEVSGIVMEAWNTVWSSP